MLNKINKKKIITPILNKNKAKIKKTKIKKKIVMKKKEQVLIKNQIKI